MKILGISDTHDSGACLLVDGKLVAVVSEERFTRLKSDTDFPYNSIDYCLNKAGLLSSELDLVALASNAISPAHIYTKRSALFSVDDWVQEMNEYWYPKIYENKDLDANDYVNIFRNNPKFNNMSNPYRDAIIKLIDEGNAHRTDLARQLRIKATQEYLKIPQDRILVVQHELCHAYYGYWASPNRDDSIVIISEGSGDDSNGSVFSFKDGKGQRIAHTLENHIGHMYKFITLILGMKPSQHEYKTMGLAPYSNIREKEKSYELLKNILEVRGLNIVTKNKPKDYYFHFKKAFDGHRFDGIAGALQEYTEDMITRWVGSIIRETGIKNIIFSGGVAQNIKVCKMIMEMEEIDNFWVNPISGDGSLQVGAAYYATAISYTDRGINPMDSISSMDTAYLGPEFTNEAIQSSLQRFEFGESIKVKSPVDNNWIADMLKDKKVVARFSGPMEFGQRALGNRSILANPNEIYQVDKINNKIKHRDFWMPFTPSLLYERSNDYIINRKGIFSPFMTIAFDATDKAKQDLPAAIHHGDYTVRPQMVTEKTNPGYYSLLKMFESKCGIGGLLNTSFNLHGFPIVCTPEDAINTFLKTDLDVVILNDTAIYRV